MDGVSQAQSTGSKPLLGRFELKLGVFAEGHGSYPNALPCTRMAVSGAAEKLDKIYRIDATGKKVEQLRTPGGVIPRIAFSPDLKWLAHL